MTESVESFLGDSKDRVEHFFKEYFHYYTPWAVEAPGGSHSQNSEGIQTTLEAMLYSLEAGGKRVRPALVYGTLRALNSELHFGDPAAAAVEMIHTYSLIHDDLPSMDNDDLRRGRPTCHVAYGEPFAILAGDGLLTEAFSLLSHENSRNLWGASTSLNVLHELCVGAGYLGMVGGQAMDIKGEGKNLSQTELESIHRCKTGALIRAAIRMGAWIGRADEQGFEALNDYALALGLAFQVADDVLDVTSDSATLGKTAGKDEAMNKSTYPALMGIEEARQYAQELAATAVSALEPFGSFGDPLRNLAKFTVNRLH